MTTLLVTSACSTKQTFSKLPAQASLANTQPPGGSNPVTTSSSSAPVTTSTSSAPVVTSTTSSQAPTTSTTSSSQPVTTSSSSTTTTTTVVSVTAPTTTTAPPVCDPFGGNPGSGAQNGLLGELFYQPNAVYPGSNSWLLDDYFTRGIKLQANIFFSQLDTPTRAWGSGFQLPDGSFLTNNNGQKLIEYFALSFQSELRLTQGDPTGNYQLAILSDDGSRVKAKLNGSANYTTLINQNKITSEYLGCSSTLINMSSAQTSIPIQVEYFQGPRYHISLIMFWRHVAGNTAPSESLCNKAGSYFDSNVTPSDPLPNYDALISHGWEPIPTANYFMPGGNTNPCP